MFAGVVGMIDPPRAGARAAIAEAMDAGIRAIKITGDHARTAARIAGSLGIADRDGNDPVVRAPTGWELDPMDDEVLRKRTRSVSVDARVAREHKASSVPWVEEFRKVILRRLGPVVAT